MNNEALLSKLVELTVLGAARNDIAKELNIHPTRVWQLRQTEDYKKLWSSTVEETLKNAKERVTAATEIALNNVLDLAMSAQNERVKLAANQDILDRGGVSKREEVSSVVTVRIEQSRIELFARTARELGSGSAPQLVEAEWKRESLLSNEEHLREGQTDFPFTFGDVQLHPAQRSKDTNNSSERSLQDDDRS